MVGVEIQGRLGNQLFQYACAITLSKRLNTPFYLKHYEHKLDVHKYFKLPRFTYFVNRAIVSALNHNLINPISIEISNFDHPVSTKVINCPETNVVYKGYFQSLLFFKNYQDDIKREFIIKRRWIKTYNKELKPKLNPSKKFVVIHVRRDDYQSHMVLPMSYYRNAIGRIKDIEGFQVILIGPNIKEYQADFAWIRNAEIISSSPINDFQLMLEADHLILSNSSFAWWGAYLSNRAKKIVAPSGWLRPGKKEYPVGISTNTSWEWL